MNRKLAITALGLLGGIVLLVFLFLGGNPVAIIRIVDSAGRPVAGAIIKPDGLRPKKNGGHYLWDDNRNPKPNAVTTGVDGTARIPYPFYTEEHLETGQISFFIEHPDYCPDRPFATVDASPPRNASLVVRLRYWTSLLLNRNFTRPAPVALTRGGILHLRGYLSQSNLLTKDLHAQVLNQWSNDTNLWHYIAPGVIECRRISPGKVSVRLVHIPADGLASFSEVFDYSAKSGETNAIDFQLRPCARVIGRVADSVPRPINNGFVIVDALHSKQRKGENWLGWHRWTHIKNDGTFTLDSLPRGTLEYVAMGDGFVSQNGSEQFTDSMRYPISVEIESGENHVIVPTEPTATLAVSVIDDKGRPLPDATAGVWPNTSWCGWGANVFGSDLYDSMEVLCNPRKGFSRTTNTFSDNFTVKSGTNGFALIQNLPATSVELHVTHSKFEMPVTKAAGSMKRGEPVTLKPGLTNYATIQMQKAGTEFVHH